MKRKYIISIILLFISFIFSYSQTPTFITDKVNEYIEKEQIEKGFWLYEAQNIVFENQLIKTTVNSFNAPNYNSYCYFIDEQPFASWSHKCRFLFINEKTGEIDSKQWTYPPQDIDKWKMITKMPDLPTGTRFSFPQRNTTNRAGIVPENCYAVIISGGADSYNNWVRYWNDCSAIYSTLVNVYGYLDDHIYVLISDGTNPANDRHQYSGSYDSSPLDLDGDGDNDIQYSATKGNISTVFNTLSNILDKEDNLFIYSTDHGGLESGDDVFINLWGETMRDDELAVEVNKVNAGNISITMEQCHSGGFVSDLSKLGRTIATGCSASESSWAMPPSYIYNEFVYHWTAAVAGQDPYGNVVNADYNSDGFISMQEAFSYAESHDARPETPQYNSTKPLLGNYMTLLGSQACTTTYVQNRIISSNETISDCKIDIQNIIIQNNSSVISNIIEEAVINGNFEVQSGSSFQIY